MGAVREISLDQFGLHPLFRRGGTTTTVDIINGMFCVSYQIIRNHIECGGVLYPFDEYNFSFSFRY